MFLPGCSKEEVVTTEKLNTAKIKMELLGCTRREMMTRRSMEVARVTENYPWSEEI